MSVTSESGAALVTALLFAALLAGIGAVLITLSTTETLIAGSQRDALEAAYAADAGFERALRDLDLLPDWTVALLPPPAHAVATFTDGRPRPVAPDGRQLDVVTLTRARQRDSDRRDGAGVFGADSPQWRLFGQAALRDLLPAGTPSQSAYVLVWVADDGDDGDGEPAKDSNTRLLVFAEAYGSGGARRTVEGSIGRSASRTLTLLAWRAAR